jgi:predicted HNH restriction endonuclease
MTGTSLGRFAFLTSRRHGMAETERVLLGYFRIDRIGPIAGLGQYAVAAEEDSPYALTVPLDSLDEAPRFWDYRAKAIPRDWRTGLFRYVADAEADAMRQAVAASCPDISAGVWRDTEAARQEEEYTEGRRSERLVAQYERSPRLRSAAVGAHGTRCQVCGFDFEASYGALGAGYIEAHHIRPLSSYEGQVRVNPRTDMGVVCANCHRIIHRHPNEPLSIEQLRRVLERRGRA